MRALAALSLAVLVSAAAAACGGGEPEGVATAPAPPETASPSDSDRPAAPPIEGETLDGDRLSLDSFGGRPVLVNVWSSW